jgi:hypothetical protein
MKEDTYALLKWLEEVVLESHLWIEGDCNSCKYKEDCGREDCVCAAVGRKDLANEIISKIRNNDVSQYPHLRKYR